MAIQLKNDVSYLFSSLNNNTNSMTGIGALSSLLGDYASIRNGSYGKLMKAYYTETASDDVSKLAEETIKKNETESKADAKVVATAQTKVDALKEAADVLYSSEEDSVWAEGDIDKIYAAVNSYVNNYNTALESIADIENETVSRRGLALIDNTKMYESDLSGIGITINKDDTLTIDEEKFKAAGVDAAADVFQGRGSYGYVQASQSGILKSAVDYAALSTSTYTNNATYNTLGTTGNIFDSLF